MEVALDISFMSFLGFLDGDFIQMIIHTIVPLLMIW